VSERPAADAGYDGSEIAVVGMSVRFPGAPEAQSWGGLLATLRDPAGNEIQLVQYPAN